MQVVFAARAIDGRQGAAQAQGARHAVGLVVLQLASPRLVDPLQAVFGAQQGTHHARQGVAVASQGDGPHQSLSDLMLGGRVEAIPQKKMKRFPLSHATWRT